MILVNHLRWNVQNVPYIEVEMNIRQTAIKWWNNLTDNEKCYYCPKWKPGALITDRVIENIYLEKR